MLRQQRPAQSPQYGAIPWDNQPANCNQQVDYTGLLPFYKGQCFVLTGINSYSGYGFTLFAHNASAETTIRGLAEYVVFYYGFIHSIASHHGT